MPWKIEGSARIAGLFSFAPTMSCWGSGRTHLTPLVRRCGDAFCDLGSFAASSRDASRAGLCRRAWWDGYLVHRHGFRSRSGASWFGRPAVALAYDRRFFWVAGLLLAFIELPDFGNPLRRMAGSLERIAVAADRDEIEKAEILAKKNGGDVASDIAATMRSVVANPVAAKEHSEVTPAGARTERRAEA